MILILNARNVVPRWRGPVTAVMLIALLAGACGGGAPPDSQGHTVVATTTILGDVARNIVGDNGTVEVLVPIGADPHDYQASAQQIATLQRADLVIANGLGLEGGLDDVLRTASEDGANVLELGEQLEPIPFTGEVQSGAGSSGLDPHFWFDPIRMAEAARLIAVELSGVDDSIDWPGRAAAYAAELSQADEDIQQILAAIPADDRKLVTNHDALGYFAARYDFEVVGVVIPGGSTLADPSSAELAALIEEIRRQEVRAVFAETTEPSALADAVAAEVGDIAVIELFTGSLGGPNSGADTLIGLLLTNASRIAAALT